MKKNQNVTLKCVVCGAPFHPFRRREATSRVCSRACNGAHQSANRNKKDEKTEFLKRVQKEDGGCWVWTGGRQGSGYGLFKCNSGTELAHRAALRLIRGEPVPDNKVVCHRCDNPSCVNPDHLFIGAQRDNVHDMISKGRHSPIKLLTGEAHPLHKLTAAEAAQIRSSSGNAKNIADAYGVSESLVYGIRKGTHWKYD